MGEVTPDPREWEPSRLAEELFRTAAPVGIVSISRTLGVAIGYGSLLAGLAVTGNLLRVLVGAALAPRYSLAGYLLTVLLHLGAMLFAFVGWYAIPHRMRHPRNPVDIDLGKGLKYFE